MIDHAYIASSLAPMIQIVATVALAYSLSSDIREMVFGRLETVKERFMGSTVERSEERFISQTKNLKRLFQV